MHKVVAMLSQLGVKTLSLLLLLLSLLVVFLAMAGQQMQQQQQIQQQRQQSYEQLLAFQQMQISRQISQWQSQLKAFAESTAVVAAMRDEGAPGWQTAEATIKHAYPAAKKVCLIPGKLSAPDANACLPISFASLNSLRQAYNNKQADVVVMRPGTAQEYILLTRAVRDNSGVLGAIMVAIKATEIKAITHTKFSSRGYLELQQGKNSVVALTKVGDPQWKKGSPLTVTVIPKTYWKIAFWPAGNANATIGAFTWAAVALIVLSLLWLFRDSIQNKILHKDITELRKQIADIEQGKMKPNYPVVMPELSTLSNDLQNYAIGNTRKNTKPSRKVKPSATGTPAQASPDIPLDQAENKQVTAAKAVSLDDQIFKMYDIRGIVDKTLTEQVMLILGKAIGSEALHQQQQQLVIGRDARLSSEPLAQAFVEGVLSSGCDVIDIGQVPTPLLYFACEHLDTHSGVMITGSHNPAEYNGLKIVIAGNTLYGPAIKKLHERIKQGDLQSGQGTSSKQNIEQAYLDKVVADIDISRPIRVVIDGGNGVAGQLATTLFNALGCQITPLYCDIDGRFPNHHPNPGDPANLQDLIAAVQQHEAELGIAFDGDGDRIGVVDAKGNIIWPDRMLILFAQDLLAQEPGASIIYDVKSTSLLDEAISRAGGVAVLSPSGHSLIKNKMQETGAKLAGEMSGHLFFKDRWYGFDDALYAAARLLEYIASDPLERTATDLFSALPQRASTPEILVPLEQDESQRFVEQLKAEGDFAGGESITVDGLRVCYPNGWGLVRASNTSPGLTLRFEAETEEELERIKQVFIQQMLQINPTLSLAI